MMNNNDPPPGKRKKVLPKCANPLFVFWLKELRDDAADKGINTQYTYGKALRSLQKYPLVLPDGKSCKILECVGDKICKILDQKLGDHMDIYGSVDFIPQEIAEAMPDQQHPRRWRPAATAAAGRATDSEGDGEHVGVDKMSSKQKRQSKGREYLPVPRSGPYAILITLSQAPGKMKKAELMRAAQPLADASFTLPDPGSRYTAWSSMGSLTRKGLVVKSGSPAIYSITPAGEQLVDRLLELDAEGRGCGADTGSVSPGRAWGSPIRRRGIPPLPALPAVSLSDLPLTSNIETFNSLQDDVLSVPLGSPPSGPFTPLKSPSTKFHGLGQVLGGAAEGGSHVEPWSDLDWHSSSRRHRHNLSPSPSPPAQPADSLDIVHIVDPLPKSATLQFTYCSDEGLQVHSKDQAGVTVEDELGGLGFLAICRDVDLLLSGVLYKRDFTRSSSAGMLFAYLADNDAPEKCPVPPKAVQQEPAIRSAPHPVPKAVPKPQAAPKSRSGSDVMSVDNEQPEFTLDVGNFDVILCVDKRESCGGASSSKQLLVPELIKHQTNFELRNLHIGDFAWVARPKNAPEGDREVVLDYVIERKRMDDLSNSICSGRFKEQKAAAAEPDKVEDRTGDHSQIVNPSLNSQSRRSFTFKKIRNLPPTYSAGKPPRTPHCTSSTTNVNHSSTAKPPSTPCSTTNASHSYIGKPPIAPHCITNATHSSTGKAPIAPHCTTNTSQSSTGKPPSTPHSTINASHPSMRKPLSTPHSTTNTSHSSPGKPPNTPRCTTNGSDSYVGKAPSTASFNANMSHSSIGKAPSTPHCATNGSHLSTGKSQSTPCSTTNMTHPSTGKAPNTPHCATNRSHSSIGNPPNTPYCTTNGSHSSTGKPPNTPHCATSGSHSSTGKPPNTPHCTTGMHYRNLNRPTDNCENQENLASSLEGQNIEGNEESLCCNDKSTLNMSQQFTKLVPPPRNNLPTGHYEQVFFDIEATGLGITSHIVQLAAAGPFGTFNRYVKPEVPMHPDAASVTGIRFFNGRLFHNGCSVYAMPIRKCLEQFLRYLPTERTLLVGHNAHQYDARVLLTAARACAMESLFERKICGFLDTLPLFRTEHPKVAENNSQVALVRHFLGEGYNAHNAKADSSALRKLLRHCEFSHEQLMAHTVSTGYVLSLLQYNICRKVHCRTLRVLVDGGALSESMAERIARHGVGYDQLVASFLQFGAQGIQELFTAPNADGKPRITKSPRIIKKVTEFIKNILKEA